MITKGVITTCDLFSDAGIFVKHVKVLMPLYHQQSIQINEHCWCNASRMVTIHQTNTQHVPPYNPPLIRPPCCYGHFILTWNNTVAVLHRGELMTKGSQNQEDASRLIKPLIHPKHIIKIGNWNVRTLYRSGNIARAAREMTRSEV